jgi:diguanylate cyclase (GGDEF)-like protein
MPAPREGRAAASGGDPGLTPRPRPARIGPVPNKHEYIVNISRDFMTLIGRDYVYEIVNDSYCRAMEKTREEILGKSVAEVWGHDTFESAIRGHLDECFSGKEVQYIERFRFGPFEKHMHVTLYPYPGDGGRVTHAAVCSHDITDLSRVESKLSHYEFRDPTTGLFNRRSLDIILDKEIEQAKRTKDRIRAVLFVSIQNLGKVNEVHGLAVGDLILENTGLRIQKCLRASDYVFRFVGNELTCLLTNIARSTDAGRVAEKIVEQVSMPYRHREGDIHIGCAVGIAVYPDDGETAEEVIRHASSAMRQALRRGSDYVFYNPAIHQRSVERMLLESDMHHAFEKEQFFLAYQPIVDSAGRIKGAEALIRWNHASRGTVAPRDFIPIAEEMGLIRSISKWALFAAAEQLGRWSSRYAVYVSVNLSAEDFGSPDLADILASALQRNNVASPAFLKLEITESQCMARPEQTIEQMGRLAAKGFDLFIDDFGTGSSSLGYLRRLPAGTVKVDRVFIDESVKSPEDFQYLASIVALARSRRKAVILEGVSTAGQYELLKRLEADGIQGFYFAKPLHAEELDALLSRGARLPSDEG